MRAAAQRVTSSKRHVLTISLEDYFQVITFRKLIQREQWHRFDTRLERNSLKALDLLDRFGIKATFFVLGWIAERYPEIIHEVVRRGHEIANKGYYPHTLREMRPDELRENMRRARVALEAASGASVVGCRIPQPSFSPADLWALDVLADEGYQYDSSMVPLFRQFHDQPWRRFAHPHYYRDRILWEFPISTYRFCGYNMPISGGNYVRQFPHWLVKGLVEQWDRRYAAPFVMYFHVWELDPAQVKIAAASPVARIRHYRNLEKMYAILEDYFGRYQFVSIATYLGIKTASEPALAGVGLAAAASAGATVSVRSGAAVTPAAAGGPGLREWVKPRTAVSIVVPCYNEELILPYLANTLDSVEDLLGEEYELSFVFVDDCSTDGTWGVLNQIFGDRPNCTLLRQPNNQGVARAILAGIRHARSEIVCSIDCDCSYDPHQLKEMLPLLADGVDMVTASPYHPCGAVRNVPGWRLSLSRVASFLYRQVLHQKLYTYTSCFRVYRRAAVCDLEPRDGRFIGIPEILGRLALRDARIVEFPTTLEVRLIGRSKMKVLRAIAGHLRLLARLAVRRLFRES